MGAEEVLNYYYYYYYYSGYLPSGGYREGVSSNRLQKAVSFRETCGRKIFEIVVPGKEIHVILRPS